MSNLTRLAVVGYGLVGRRHVQAIRQAPSAVAVAVVESSPAARATIAAADVTVLDSLESLLARGDVDGVVLATPTALHVEQALACIERGIAVLVEKPIAVTAARAAVLIEAADAGGVPILVGHHRRHSGVVRAAKAAIDAGTIGTVRAVQATCWLYKPDRYFEVSPWRKREGAGPVSVNLVHDVDLLRHFCGEVDEVHAVAAPALRGYENEDLAAAVLRFRDGAIATVSVSDSVAAPWSWEMTARENPVYPATDQSCYLVGGSAGSLSVPDLRVWSHRDGPDWWTPIDARPLPAASNDPLLAQIEHFTAVIRGRARPLVSGLDGLRSLQVVEAVQRSAATGRAARPGEPDLPPRDEAALPVR